MFLLVKYQPWLISSLVFLVALTYFASMLPRDITWVNVGSDGPDYMIAAKYWRVAHPTGEPLYTLLGAGWIRAIPFGSEWWRYSLLSAVFSAGTASILYTATRSLLAPSFFLASGVVVSQSTILELYAPVTFFIVLAWWLHSLGYRAWGYAAVGLGLAVHHLAGFMFLGLLAKDYLEKKSLLTGVWAVVVGLSWYAYIPLANRPPYISVSGPGLFDYYRFFFSQGSLLGGLAVMGGQFSLSEDFRERLWDLTRIVLALGPALVLLFVGIKQSIPKKTLLLPLLILAYMLYWFTDLDPRVYTYTMVAVALAAVIIAKVPGLTEVKQLSSIFCGGFIVMNLFAYDIGSEVDPNHSAETFNAELAKLPPNAVVWTYNRGWEAMTAELYNHDHGTNFNTVLMAHYRQDAEAGLRQAEQEGRLYRTYIVDGPTYTVALEHTTVELVMREADEQDLRNYQRKKVQ